EERDADLDQPAGQQTALAESAAAVRAARRGRLLRQVKRLGLLRLHQAHGPLVGRAMVAASARPVRLEKTLLHLLQQPEPAVESLGLHGRLEVLDAAAGVGDDQRLVPRAEEARTVTAGAGPNA